MYLKLLSKMLSSFNTMIYSPMMFLSIHHTMTITSSDLDTMLLFRVL